MKRDFERSKIGSPGLPGLPLLRCVTGKSITYAEPLEASAWRHTSLPYKDQLDMPVEQRGVFRRLKARKFPSSVTTGSGRISAGRKEPPDGSATRETRRPPRAIPAVPATT